MKNNELNKNKIFNFEKENKFFKKSVEKLNSLGHNSLTFSNFKRRKLDKNQEISKFFYTNAYFILRILTLLLFRFKVKRAKELKHLSGPNIIIAPHSSYLDPVFVMLAWGNKSPLYFLASNFLRESKGFLKWLTVKMCTINITQFNSDFMAVKRMLNLLRNGKNIAIFPEGERSGDGRHELFSDAFIKLLQRSQANIIFCNLEGAFLSWPRWGGNSNLRLGKVEAEISLLWSKEEIAQLDAETIRETVAQLFNDNDYNWQLENAEKGKKTHKYLCLNRAKGLNNLLHSCPCCGESCAMFQKSYKLISCAYCNFTAELASDGLFKKAIEFPAVGKNKVVVSRNPIVWHLWQIRHNTVRFLKHAAPAYLLATSGEVKIEEYLSDEQVICHTEKDLAYFALDWKFEEPRFTLAFAHKDKEALPDLQQELEAPNALSPFLADSAIVAANCLKQTADSSTQLTTETEQTITAEATATATEQTDLADCHTFTHLLKVPAQHFVYEDINSYFQFWVKNFRITYTPTDPQLIYLYRDLIEGLGQSTLDPRLAKCHVDSAKDLIANFKVSSSKLKTNEKV